MNSGKHNYRLIILLTAAMLIVGFALPSLRFLITVALAKGLAVLGLFLLLRTGLVSFGQALYYCLGAYTVGILGEHYGITDVVLTLVSATLVATAVAIVLGLLMSAYRNIFFAMLSLAFSMVLYGLLVNISALGSTDGFNVPAPTLFGQEFSGSYPLYVLTSLVVLIAACALQHYSNTPLGRLSQAIRDNEIRVEYMGASVKQAIFIKYVIAAALTGAGGAIAAMAVGHVDPDAAYWTTSGEFVFIVVLSGIGNVIAPFLGSLIFEAVRTFATQFAPNTWQLILGTVLLVIIVFMPNGLWSLFSRKRAEGAS